MASSSRAVPGSPAKRRPSRYASTCCWSSTGYAEASVRVKATPPDPAGRPGAPPSSSQEPLLALRLAGGAGPGVDLGADPLRQVGAALDQVGRLLRVDGLGAQLVGHRLQLARQLLERGRLAR